MNGLRSWYTAGASPPGACGGAAALRLTARRVYQTAVSALIAFDDVLWFILGCPSDDSFETTKHFGHHLHTILWQVNLNNWAHSRAHWARRRLMMIVRKMSMKMAENHLFKCHVRSNTGSTSGGHPEHPASGCSSELSAVSFLQHWPVRSPNFRRLQNSPCVRARRAPGSQKTF